MTLTDGQSLHRLFSGILGFCKVVAFAVTILDGEKQKIT